jgi:hypothetical protein
MSCVSRRPGLSYLVAAVIGAAIGILVANEVMPANAGSTSNLRVVRIGNADMFYNYDFLPKDDSLQPEPDGTNPRRVDWPMNLLFWHYANTFKIADRFADKYDAHGTEMYGRINDGDGWNWKADIGIKETFCPQRGSTHFRRYTNKRHASSYDRRWGFYVLATSHVDFRECAEGKWAGKSEQAEAEVAQDAREYWGAPAVHEDALNWENRERYRREGAQRNHIWQNSGYASTIKVPRQR